MSGLFNATPSGVPVEIISPFSSVITLLSLDKMDGIFINILFVDEFCLISPLTLVVICKLSTSIISSDVGIAPEFLPSESIFDWRNWESYRNAKPNPEYVKNNVDKCVIPQYFNKFINLMNMI